MYNIFRILIEVPDYSSSLFVFFEKWRGSYSPRRKKIFRDNKRKYYNDISTCPDYGRVTDLGEKSGMPDTEENIIVHHLTLLRSAAKA